MILLQTASVLHDPECLAVLHTALTADIKLIPVRLCFAEPEKDPLHYDFEQQHAHIADLGEGLSKAAMNTLEQLTLANTDDVSRDTVQPRPERHLEVRRHGPRRSGATDPAARCRPDAADAAPIREAATTENADTQMPA